jgi:carboxymethylenebutenolidase
VRLFSPCPRFAEQRVGKQSKTEIMRTESVGRSYLALPDGIGPFPGVVVVHEASGLNDNIRDICGRFAAEGYAALGVDLFSGRSRAACMARMFVGGMAGNLDYYGVQALKDALGRLADRPEVDAVRIGAIGFCLGGSVVLTWACTDNRLAAIAPFYGTAPRPREAIRRMCPVVGHGRERTSLARPPGIRGPSTPSSTTGGTPIPVAAADSWQRVLVFFAEHVRTGPP